MAYNPGIRYTGDRSALAAGAAAGNALQNIGEIFAQAQQRKKLEDEEDKRLAEETKVARAKAEAYGMPKGQAEAASKADYEAFVAGHETRNTMARYAKESKRYDLETRRLQQQQALAPLNRRAAEDRAALARQQLDRYGVERDARADNNFARLDLMARDPSFEAVTGSPTSSHYLSANSGIDPRAMGPRLDSMEEALNRYGRENRPAFEGGVIDYGPGVGKLALTSPGAGQLVRPPEPPEPPPARMTQEEIDARTFTLQDGRKVFEHPDGRLEILSAPRAPAGEGAAGGGGGSPGEIEDLVKRLNSL